LVVTEVGERRANGSTAQPNNKNEDKTKTNAEDTFMATQGEDLVALYDQAPLNARYWASMALAGGSSIFDFFDFFIVGFLVAVLAPQWHLTFGQTSVMLLSAGIGAIAGSLAWGALGDSWGRRNLLAAGVAICGLGSGSICLIPDGAWMLFSALRFAVGFGVGAASAVALPMIVEYTPTRYRTIIGGATLIPVSVGIFSASLTAATLLHTIGWRGLASLGYIPLIPAFLILLIVPESVRWLVSRGRFMEARKIVGQALNVPAESLPLPSGASETAANARAQASRFSDLYAQPRLFWLTVILWFGASTANYGVFLWGPTIVALLMGVSPQDAARLFVYVSFTGIIGRVAFAILPQWLGRRRCGEIMGYGIAVTLGAAAIFCDRTWFGYPAFVALLIPAALFFDGGFANIAPYAAETFPVRLSARAVGLSQAANGVGKIAGPLCLALIAGASNLITPKATMEAVTPAFLFLACCGLAIGLSFSLLGVETHGKSLTLEADDTSAPRGEAFKMQEQPGLGR
jgi:MFS transporter, putative metabolite:H+ symporter